MMNAPPDQKFSKLTIAGVCLLLLFVSAGSVAALPLTESFETGLGAWVNAAGDDGDWTRKSGDTLSSYTGPSTARDGSYYLYTESSSGQIPGSPNKTATLDVAVDFSSISAPTLTFYYHMYGASMGSLQVDVYDGTWHIAVWSRSGQQHASSSDPWTYAFVDLSDFGNTSGIILRVRGVTGSSFTSDMAIDLIRVQDSQHETHYVDLNNATPEFPYATWTTAATNIQDAVDAATSNDVVLVSDGTYNLTSEITVTNNIELRSVNGPDLTIVDGGNITRCFNLGTNDCRLSGFTIRNGSPGVMDSQIGAGIYCLNTAPVVSNCMILNNHAFLPGGGMNGGTAYNCTFSSNSVSELGGSGMAYGVAYNSTFIDNARGGLQNCTAYNCIITGNSGVFSGGMGGGAAYNCIFTSNLNGRNGGGMTGGTATNCIFTSNSSSDSGGGMANGAAYNCIFNGNWCNDSGGGRYGGATINCTLIDNYTIYGDGGGMYGGTATHCILYNNLAGRTGNDTYLANASFSCASDLTHGSDGNITNAPQFVNPTGSYDFGSSYRIN